MAKKKKQKKVTDPASQIGQALGILLALAFLASLLKEVTTKENSVSDETGNLKA